MQSHTASSFFIKPYTQKPRITMHPKVFSSACVTFHSIFLKAPFIVLSRIVAYLFVCKVVV